LAAEGWDECRGHDGALRPAWQRFFDNAPALRGDAAAAFEHQRAAIAQQIRADGVTHNVHAADAVQPAAARPWSLESLPLLENSDDFVFDNQMLAQILLAGFEVGEISCPAAYFEEASSINFSRSLSYGLGVLRVSLAAYLHRKGLAHMRIFDPGGRRLLPAAAAQLPATSQG